MQWSMGIWEVEEQVDASNKIQTDHIHNHGARFTFLILPMVSAPEAQTNTALCSTTAGKLSSYSLPAAAL